MNIYIVFENTLDPSDKKPRSVSRSYEEAIHQKILLCEERVMQYNENRAQAFANGRSFGKQAVQDDVWDRFDIEKVQ